MSVAQQLIVTNAAVPKRFAPEDEIAKCSTYSDAVRLAWKCRIRPNMTKAQLAEETGIPASHINQILNENRFDKHGRPHKELGGKYVKAFERAVGNHIVKQWMTADGDLRILEFVMASKGIA
jgi:hypothetical protein